MHRLFLALWPADAVRAALADWQAQWRFPAGARVVPAGNLHLTLHFLGSVAPATVAALGPMLDEVRCEPFTLRFGSADDWRGIAVLKPLETPPPLAALHRSLAQVLGRCDVPVEQRPFRPHVTLARKASGGKPPPSGFAFEWPAECSFALVDSPGDGQRYQVLHRFRMW